MNFRSETQGMMTDARDVPAIQFEDIPDAIRAKFADVFKEWWNDGMQGAQRRIPIALPWPWPPFVMLEREEVFLRSAAPAYNELGPHVGMIVRPGSELDKMALTNYAASLT